VQVASLGVQVHGGMGFVEEAGAAQHLRDARITTIYEGTTAIQALDLIGRKIMRDGGAAAAELTAEIRATAQAMSEQTGAELDWAALTAQVTDAALMIEETTAWLLAQNGHEPQAAAVTILELLGIALGAWAMCDSALSTAQRLAKGQGGAPARARLNTVVFYMTNVFPQARGLQTIATQGAASVLTLQAADFGVSA